MLLLASVDSFSYKLLFLLHIVAIVVAFAPAFVNPSINGRLRGEGSSLAQHPRVAAIMARNTQLIHGPALALAGLFGIGMIFSSDKTYKFSQAWVSIAFVLWIALLGVVFAALNPAEKRVGDGDEAALKRVNMFGGIVHLLFLLMVIDMIWKPGF